MTSKSLRTIIIIGTFLIAVYGAILADEKQGSKVDLASAARKEREARWREDEREFERRRSQITEEYEKLAGHDWAGSYFHGCGAGPKWLLWMTPKSGCVFELVGCLGSNYRNHGTVKVRDDRVRIDWTDDGKIETEEYLLIRWGPRRYLVRPEEILDFCGDVESEREPDRRFPLRLFYVRDTEAEKPVDGKPALPKGFERYLEMKPIRCSITAVSAESDVPTEWGTNQVTTTVTICAGEAEGLLPRMKFEAVEPKGSDVRIRITAVRAHTSEGTATVEYNPMQKRPDLPAVGWKLSTGHRFR
jgi:hypothetical protein